MRLKLIPMILALALTVPGCAQSERIKMLTPPVADLRAVTEPKPIPPSEILTDPAAAVRYDAELEAWGERLSAAGGRLCRWFVANGMAVDCPK